MRNPNFYCKQWPLSAAIFPFSISLSVFSCVLRCTLVLKNLKHSVLFYSMSWTNLIRTFQGLLRSSTEPTLPPSKVVVLPVCLYGSPPQSSLQFYNALLYLAFLILYVSISLSLFFCISFLLLCDGTASFTSIIIARLRTQQKNQTKQKLK